GELAPLHYRLNRLDWRPVHTTVRPESPIRLVHDEAGRVIVREAADGPTIRYTYSDAGDLLEAHIDGLREPHRFATDAWGRIIQHERPDGSIREWAFDELGRVSTVRDGTPGTADPEDRLFEPRLRWETVRLI